MVGLNLYSPIAEHSINILLLMGLGGDRGFFSGLGSVGFKMALFLFAGGLLGSSLGVRMVETLKAQGHLDFII